MSLAERVNALYAKMCQGKRSYDTELEASRARLRMQHRHAGQQFDYYRCTFCGLFHVGHSRKCDCCRGESVVDDTTAAL